MLDFRWRRKIVELRHLLVMAVPVGLVTGATVGGFELLCNQVLWSHLGSMAVPTRVLWLIVGLGISGVILNRLHVQSVGMLNEVVVHYHEPPKELQPGADALKLAACTATVGLGASAGLGGPSQWLGARVALYFTRAFKKLRGYRRVSERHSLLIGAAAGVAAIFRAPLAGTLLALETPFKKDIDGTVLLPASVAALSAHFTHGLIVDRYPVLKLAESADFNLRSILAAVVIGVAAGSLSRSFQGILQHTRDFAGRFHWSIRALAGGLVTSATAIIAWHAFGDTWTLQSGIALAERLFAGDFVGQAALCLLVLKLIAVWATFGTSGVAGLLFVTLTVGSLLGAALQPWLPQMPAAVACSLAVCAYLAANYNAPLTAVALAAEWGGTQLLPLAWISVLVSAWIGEGLANTPSKTGHRPHGPIGHH